MLTFDPMGSTPRNSTYICIALYVVDTEDETQMREAHGFAERISNSLRHVDVLVNINPDPTDDYYDISVCSANNDCYSYMGPWDLEGFTEETLATILKLNSAVRSGDVSFNGSKAALGVRVPLLLWGMDGFRAYFDTLREEKKWDVERVDITSSDVHPQNPFRLTRLAFEVFLTSASDKNEKRSCSIGFREAKLIFVITCGQAVVVRDETVDKMDFSVISGSLPSTEYNPLWKKADKYAVLEDVKSTLAETHGISLVGQHSQWHPLFLNSDRSRGLITPCVVIEISAESVTFAKPGYTMLRLDRMLSGLDNLSIKVLATLTTTTPAHK